MVEQECVLTDVCSVDEAKEVEERYRWNDHEVDLQTELGFGLGVDLHERVAISGGC